LSSSKTSKVFKLSIILDDFFLSETSENFDEDNGVYSFLSEYQIGRPRIYRKYSDNAEVPYSEYLVNNCVIDTIKSNFRKLNYL